MSRVFAALHRFCWERPRAVVAILGILTAIAVLGASRLRFSSDIGNILPKDSPAVNAVKEVMDHFDFTGQMFVFFEKKDPAATDAAAMKLAAGFAKRMRQSPDVTHVDERITPESEAFLAKLVSEKGPLLMEEERMPAFLERLTAPEIRKAVRRNRKRLEGAGIGAADVLVAVDPLDLTRDFFLKSLEAGRPQGQYDLSSGYYFNHGRTALFMTVEGKRPPQDVAFARRLVDQANVALAEARAEAPEAAGWQVTLLGGYPIALQNENTIKNDLAINLLTSIPPVLLMLVISLRRWFGLAIGAASLTLGIAWTFGLAGFVYGRLTGVTVAFAALLAGIGIDLTFHMFHRYRHELKLGLSPADASATTYAGTGPGAFIAMITTVFSILCLFISSFSGLREFAILVGVGLGLVFTATFLIIPLFTRRERPDAGAREVRPWIVRVCWALFGVYLVASVGLYTAFGLMVGATCVLIMTDRGMRAILALVVKRPGVTMALCAAITAAALVAMARPPFGLPVRETDVNNLRTEGDTLMAAQARLRAAYGSGIDPILVLDSAASEDEALEKAAAVSRALAPFPDSSHQAITRFVPAPSRQARQAGRLAAVDADRVVADLDAALEAEGFDPAAFEDARARLRRLLAAREPVRPSAIDDPFFVSIRHRFLDVAPDGSVRVLTWFVPLSPLHVKDERNEVITKLDAAARGASPTARLSGFSVVVKEIDDRIGPDIFWSSIAGAAASCLLAWVLYGSFRWMVVSIYPAIVGSFWLIGLLKLLEIKMNYLNLITFPIMTGLATDNGLYLVERFREVKRRSAYETVESVWPSLTLVSMSTVVGFGSLAFSTNRAMRSLGIALSVSMLVYLFASILLLPPVLKWLEVKEPEKPA